MPQIHHAERNTVRYRLWALIGRLLAIARDVVMAHFYGSGALIGSFFVALRFALLPGYLMSEGVMQASLVPQLQDLKIKGLKSESARLIRDLMLLLGGLALLLVLAIGTALYVVKTRSALTPLNDELFSLTILLLPAIVLDVLFAINIAFLTSEKMARMSSTAWYPFLGCWIVGAVLFRHAEPWPAVVGLSLSVLIGILLSWLMGLCVVLSRLLPDLLKASRPYFSNLGVPLKAFLFALVAYSAELTNLTVSPLFARIIDPGAPVYLFYGWRLQQLLIVVVSYSLVGGLLPFLAHAVKSHNLKRYEELFSFALRRTLEACVPLSVALALFGFLTVDLYLGRGAFTVHDVLITTRCTVVYGVGLIFRTIVLIHLAVLFSQGRRAAALWSALLSIGVNLLLNAVLVLPFSLGPGYVALFNVFCSALQGTILFYLIWRAGLHIAYSPVWRALFRTLLASLVVAALSSLIYILIFHTLPWTHSEVTRALELGEGFWMKFGRFAVGMGSFFGLLYLGRRLFLTSHLNADED